MQAVTFRKGGRVNRIVVPNWQLPTGGRILSVVEISPRQAPLIAKKRRAKSAQRATCH